MNANCWPFMPDAMRASKCCWARCAVARAIQRCGPCDPRLLRIGHSWCAGRNQRDVFIGFEPLQQVNEILRCRVLVQGKLIFRWGFSSGNASLSSLVQIGRFRQSCGRTIARHARHLQAGVRAGSRTKGVGYEVERWHCISLGPLFGPTVQPLHQSWHRLAQSGHHHNRVWDIVTETNRLRLPFLPQRLTSLKFCESMTRCGQT